MSQNDKLFRRSVVLLLIMLLAATLRLSLLGSKSLWFDEAYSVVESSYTQEKIWVSEPHRTDSHPPLYYSGLYYWEKEFGASEFSVRLPSSFVSIISIGLLYLLAQRLFGTSVALVSAALLALSPLDIWYAQEARMYIFMAAIILLAANLILWDSWWSVIPLSIVLACGLYMDYTMLPLWIGLSAIWFAWWWSKNRSLNSLAMWLLASLLAFVFFLPWFDTFMEWLDRFNEVTFYLRLSDTMGLPELSAWSYILLAILGGAAAIPLISCLIPLLNRPESRRWITILVLVGFILANIFFILPRFYSLKRLIVQAWPLVILFTAWLIVKSPRKLELSTVLIAVSLLASLVSLLFVGKDDWRSSTAYINENSSMDDVVILQHAWNRMATNYYDLNPKLTTKKELESSLSLGETSMPSTNIWYLEEHFPDQQTTASPEQQWLDLHLELLESVHFTRIELRKYRFKAQ